MKKLWHHAYWDVALSGVCEVDGKKCWFEIIEEYFDNNDPPEEYGDDWDPPWYRRFLIVALTVEQFNEIEKRHDKFRRMVGTHTDYDDQGHRGTFHYTDTITQQSFDQYFRENKKELSFDFEAFSEAHVLGWVEI
jgi:hypothetical protein